MKTNILKPSLKSPAAQFDSLLRTTKGVISLPHVNSLKKKRNLKI